MLKKKNSGRVKSYNLLILELKFKIIPQVKKYFAGSLTPLPPLLIPSIMPRTKQLGKFYLAQFVPDIL
jgi:hypothetical protein